MLETETLTGARHLALDAPTLPPTQRLPAAQRRRRKRQLLLLFLLLLLFATAAGTALWWFKPGQQPNAGASATSAVVPSTGSASVALPPLPPPNLLRPLTPEDAVTQNEARPVIARPDTAASAFHLSGDAISKLRAVDCLTQAVYYEAASEGVEGGRAVAQVVLNRLHHPGYPDSVCGVVYQGGARAAGCQFTFTCDGSLARVPAGYLWARSRQIATEALAGRVFAEVGHATHYHANYVVPYWADSLDKVAVIGRHIFYRLRGSNGSAAAFSQRYAATEPLPPPPPPATDPIQQGLDSLAPTVAIDPNVPPASKVEEDHVPQLETAPKAVQERSNLQADLSRGQLILGEPTAPTQDSPPKKKALLATECNSAAADRIKAAAAVDLKAGSSSPAC